MAEEPKTSAPSEGKDVAYYTALVEAWIANRMELDRTVVTLSAGGIGLLITILTTVGVARRWHLAVLAVSALGFGVALMTALLVFKRNADLIEAEVLEKPEKPSLKKLDFLKIAAFGVGVIGFLFVGAVSAYNASREGEEKAMKNQKVKIDSGGTLEKRSLEGLGKLRPQKEEQQGGKSANDSSGQQSKSKSHKVNNG